MLCFPFVLLFLFVSLFLCFCCYPILTCSKYRFNTIDVTEQALLALLPLMESCSSLTFFGEGCFLTAGLTVSFRICSSILTFIPSSLTVSCSKTHSNHCFSVSVFHRQIYTYIYFINLMLGKFSCYGSTRVMSSYYT